MSALNCCMLFHKDFCVCQNITISLVRQYLIVGIVMKKYDFKLQYCIVQNFGGKKFWRYCDFEILAEKTLADPRVACIFIIVHTCITTLKSVNYPILYTV